MTSFFDVTFVTPYVTKCDILSHAINRMENKIKRKEKNINNDLGFKGQFMTIILLGSSCNFQT